jgi:hypothetical protein
LKIKLTPEQAEKIVIKEMKRLLLSESQEGPEYALAAHTVLKYYMPALEYEDWCERKSTWL